MIAPPVSGPIEQARLAVRRAAVRRQLKALAGGKRHVASIDLNERGVDVASMTDALTRHLHEESIEVRRLVWSFQRAGLADAALDGLSSRSAAERRSSARLVGALRVESAVGPLAALLGASDRSVSDAAARALGRIGGARSAEALLSAVQRHGMRRTLIGELAHAAPDLFLEVRLGEPQRPGLMPAIALAAGLRRRRTAARPLMVLAVHGNRRERVISCRALGWLRTGSALGVLVGALEDPEWKVRASAAKALGVFRMQVAAPALEARLDDSHPRVRGAAQMALRRLEAR